jgi:hypothetical protein
MQSEKNKLMTLYVVLVKPNILKTISDSYCWNKNKMFDLNYDKEEKLRLKLDVNPALKKSITI